MPENWTQCPLGKLIILYAFLKIINKVKKINSTFENMQICELVGISDVQFCKLLNCFNQFVT